MSDHQVVVAIDLGTHGTGYAWSEVRALNNDMKLREIYIQNEWPGAADRVYPKNLSAVVVDSEGTICAWGFEAENLWNDKLQSDETDGFGYAYAFKMALRRGSGSEAAVGRGTVDLSDPRTVLRLMSGYLEKIKDSVLGHIGDSNWSLRHVRWCITVPAIWDDAEKQLVRQAAHDAGIPSDDDTLLIAIEPEAAALYCSVRVAQVLNGEGSEELLSLHQDGTRFMVIDCGGGTVDLTAHRTELNDAGETRLADIGRPTGGRLGSAHLNHAFRESVLADRVGADMLEHLKQAFPGGLAELDRSWEANKVKVRAETDDEGEPVVASPIRISIPPEIWDELDPETKERVTERSGGFKGRIVVERPELQKLMDQLLDPILERIEEQLAEMRRVTGISGDEVLLIVGGFARSEYLRLRIRQRFADRTTVMTPPDPALAVLSGAVHFCYKPELIRTRRARLTYGFSILKPFDSNRDPVEKRYKSPSDNQVYCQDRFEVAATRGEPLEIDEPWYEVVVPSEPENTGIMVNFYATRDLDPRYVDEPGCERLGSVEVDLSDSVGQDKSDRAVGVYMYFGRTTIQVKAKNISTGEVADTELAFQAGY